MFYLKLMATIFAVGTLGVGLYSSLTKYSDMLPYILFVDVVSAAIIGPLLVSIWKK